MAEATAVVDRPPGGRRWLRRFVTVMAVLFVSLSALVVWAGGLGLDRYFPLAQLYSFRVQALATLFAVGLVALLLTRGRRRVWGAVVLLLALSPLPQLLPRVIGDGATGTPQLRILAINVEASGADVDRVVALAVERNADVVALPEGSAGFAAEVRRRAAAAGLDLVGDTDNPAVRTGSYFEDGEPRVRSSGPYPTSLLVRRTLAPTFDLTRPTGTLGNLTADVTVGGRPLAVAAVHPSPPVPSLESDWRVSHRFLEALCAPATPTVLVGDFNSTLDHSVMRDLLDAGCRDAAEITGNGLTGTWPSSVPRALRIPIDHLLLTPAAGTVLSYEVVEVAGTDHLGTFTVLALPTSG